jgi:hypothetical protein
MNTVDIIESSEFRRKIHLYVNANSLFYLWRICAFGTYSSCFSWVNELLAYEDDYSVTQ